MKINGENLLDVFRLLHPSLGTINACSDLFVNCIWIAEIFEAKFMMMVCLIPLE